MVFYNIGLSLYFIFFLRASSHIVIFHSKILKDDVGCIGKTNNKLKRFIKKGKKNKRWHIFKAETQTLRANGDLTHKTHVQLPHQISTRHFTKKKLILQETLQTPAMFRCYFIFSLLQYRCFGSQLGAKRQPKRNLSIFGELRAVVSA